MNKKGMWGNLLGGLVFLIVIVVVIAAIYLDSNNLKDREDVCKEHNLEYRSKPCGFGCKEYQCLNETDFFEIIKKEDGGYFLLEK